MRVPASDVSAGELGGRPSWVHLGIRLEADQLAEAELLAKIAEGGRVFVERCSGDDGLHLRLRIEPAEPLSVLAPQQSDEAATDASPSDVHQPLLERNDSARVRRADFGQPDDVAAVMELAAGVLPFIQPSDALPEWLWTAGGAALIYEDESGTARLALARSQGSFSTLADTAWLRSLGVGERVDAFRALLEAAARESPRPITAVRLIFPAALLSFAGELRAAGVIGRPVSEMSVATVRDHHVERVS